MQWHMPIGYNIRNGIIVINEEQSKLVQNIFNEYDNGISTVRIAKDLVKHGINNANEKVAWTHGTIGRILENHNYLGTKVYPRIIDDALFQRVQDKREQIRKATSCGIHRPAAKERMLFGGVLVCGVCGQTYSHIMPKKTSTAVPKWKCKDYVYRNQVSCAGGFISDKEVMQVCVDAINQLIENKRLIHNVESAKEKVSLRFRNLDSKINETNDESAEDIMVLLFNRAAERYKTLKVNGINEYTKEMLECLEGIEPLEDFNEELYQKLIKRLTVYKDNTVEVGFINGCRLKIEYGNKTKVRKGEYGGNKNSKKGVNNTGKTSV